MDVRSNDSKSGEAWKKKPTSSGIRYYLCEVLLQQYASARVTPAHSACVDAFKVACRAQMQANTPYDEEEHTKTIEANRAFVSGNRNPIQNGLYDTVFKSRNCLTATKGQQ